jgi:hypothetical protein
VFSDRASVSLRYTKEGGVAPFGFTRSADALGGKPADQRGKRARR